MLPHSIVKNSRRGTYQPVHDLDGKDGTGNTSELRNGKIRPSFLWLYLSLSAFSGFVVAVAMVNLFPGHLVPDYGSSRLQKLLRMPKETVVFSPIKMFQEAPTKESDTAWESLLGPSIGLISLNNSKDYGLPKGADGHVYQLSVVHQIQCLYLIRKVYWGENRGIFGVSTDPPSPFIEHTNHCFDYLLQSIKCAADMTLETTTDGSGNFIGWNVEHTCSKWGSVLEFMKKYKDDAAENAIDHHDHDDKDDDGNK